MAIIPQCHSGRGGGAATHFLKLLAIAIGAKKEQRPRVTRIVHARDLWLQVEEYTFLPCRHVELHNNSVAVAAVNEDNEAFVCDVEGQALDVPPSHIDHIQDLERIDTADVVVDCVDVGAGDENRRGCVVGNSSFRAGHARHIIGSWH